MMLINLLDIVKMLNKINNCFLKGKYESVEAANRAVEMMAY